jgi:membrane protein DedA with SNARE-associated domain
MNGANANFMGLSLFNAFGKYISYYPLFAFLALMLAGLNLPFSEDLIIVTGALLCQENEQLLIPCFVSIISGVLISDFISYFIGYSVKRGAIDTTVMQSVLRHRYTARLQQNLIKHGIWTFIICRFIPFGVRNALFMSSGFLGLKIKRFALYDIIAALINVNTLFWLVFLLGEGADKPLHLAGAAMFFLLAGIIVTLVARLIVKSAGKRPKL